MVQKAKKKAAGKDPEKIGKTVKKVISDAKKKADAKKAKGKKTKGKKEDDAKQIQRAEKKQAKSDYEKLLCAVREAKEMTDTSYWRKFYAGIMGDIEGHARSVLDAEKSRDVVHHQEGVKILRAMVVRVREPIDELNSYIAGCPLFTPLFPIRAEWNSALGRVELRTVR